MLLASGQRISQYEVLERVGSGGMGDVYRARDKRLERDVALKFLSSVVGPDPVARERLVREARAASMLDHPNVCTVYEVDESDEGELFIAMAYCPGRTLEQRLRQDEIPVAHVVEIARQVANGLAAAHAKGIVHRDVKPGNVMINDELSVKLVDFGLAKLAESTLTRDGAVAGTTAYMAPEQLRGEAVSSRADVWAFGAVLYEMLAGRPPFEADYEQALMYRILHEEPEPLEVDLPPHYQGLAEIVDSCLKKDPAQRPSMQRIAKRLRADVIAPSARGPMEHPAPRSLFRGAHARKLVAGIAVLLFVAAGVFFLAAPGMPAEKYVVVLPLTATGGDEDDRLLADGLTVTLTNKLVQLAGYTDEPFWVVPYSEVRDRELLTPSVARRALGATLALEGSLVRVRTGIRLTLSIIDTRTLRTLRAVDLTILNSDLGGLHDQAVFRLGEMIQLQIADGSREVLRAGGTDDPEAIKLFVHARALLERYERTDNVEAAVDLLRRATERDPFFAEAFAVLGEAKWRLYENTKDELYVPLALRHLDQALAIEARLPAAHVALARVHAGTDRLDEARRAIERAIAQEPRNANAFIILGSIEHQAGRESEAEAAYKQAVDLRPSYWDGHNQLGGFYYRRGRYEEAEAAWREVIRLTPDNARGHSNLGAVYSQMQRFEESAASFERSIELEPTYGALSNLATLYFFQLEDMERAVTTYRHALDIQDGDYRPWYYLAIAYDRLGREGERDATRREAIRRAERLLQLNPRDQRATIDLASMYIAVENIEPAASMIDQLSTRHIEEIEIIFLIAEAYEQLEERRKALDWACRALAAGYSTRGIEQSEALAPLLADGGREQLLACAHSTDPSG